MRLVLIGHGAWGKNYVKTIAGMQGIDLIIASRANWQELVRGMPDGVIIATQPDSHVDIALYALERGIPTLIEKPLAVTHADAERLLPYSSRVMVNHIHLFAPEFEKLIYKPGDFVSVTSTGPVEREGYSPVLDYGCHAYAMLLDKTGSLDDARINIGHGEKRLEMMIEQQVYTLGQPILHHAINKFLELINGGTDRRFGVEMSLRILKVLGAS